MPRPDWLEPEEGWNPGWKPGTIVLEKRSGRVMVLGKQHTDYVQDGYCSAVYGDDYDLRYHSYRVTLLDGSDPHDGVYRPPDDLRPLGPLELLALQAEVES